MEQIAFIWSGKPIYWSSLIVMLAAVAAGLLFLWLYLRRPGTVRAGVLLVVCASLLSLIFSRWVHWYRFPQNYTGLADALLNLTDGGFVLIGAFLGCPLAAVLLRFARQHDSIPRALDAMCLAGGLGIAAGRLACFCSAADRGAMVSGVQSLPWVYPALNAVTGQPEYRFATFFIQALVTLAISGGLLWGYLKNKRRDGDTCLLFLLWYCASQVVLDSTRYDSVYFRFNGFISIVQVMSAVTLVGVIVFYSVRLVRTVGFRRWMVPVWILMAALLGCAGYMEYYVQRHGTKALFSYSVMSICLLTLGMLTVGEYLFPGRMAGKGKQPTKS